jgi:CRISPR-associated protein Csb2
VALPFVHARQRHADGTLKGLAVLVPRSASQNDLMALALGLGELQQNGLGISGIGTWHLEEVPEDAPPLCALATATWQGPSRRWVTATPMEFGHFPKPSNGGEAKVVLDSVRMAGVDPDRVVEIAVGRHSPLHGASPSWHFKPRSNDSDNGAPRRLLRHVTLLFDRPVAGPLLLGAKRYFGLGLMYPLRGR